MKPYLITVIGAVFVYLAITGKAKPALASLFGHVPG